MSFYPQETWATIVLARYTGSVSWVYIGRLVPGSRLSPSGWLGRLRRRLVRQRRYGNSSTWFVLIWSWLRLVFFLSSTVLWVRWEPLSPRLSMWVGVIVAGWSVWLRKSNADLKKCKLQFRGFLWNWRFPSFRLVDRVLWGLLAILVIVAIIIAVTFVVSNVS